MNFNLKSIIDKVRSLFNRERTRKGKEVSLDSVSNRPSKIIYKGSRVQRRIDWCKSFMERNGNIVPDRSAISIYFKSGGK